MKKLIIGTAIAVWSLIASADCTVSTTVDSNGRVMFCEMCCTPNGGCQVVTCWH